MTTTTCPTRRSLPARLRIEIDRDHLLRDLRAFFQSPEDACAEIVQNAFRAGATSLHLHQNGHTLQFTDNGPGLNDPRDIFTAARSGWDPSRVVDAAGLGAFAMFGLADQVTVVSVPQDDPTAAWQATLTAECFLPDGPDIELQPCAPPFAHGLRITAVIPATVRLPDFKNGHWRHAFPLNVTFETADAVHEVAPITLEGEPIDTPAGQIRFFGRHDRLYSQSFILWEHRRLSDNVSHIEDLILEQIPNTPAGALLRCAFGRFAFSWVLNPDTGVRPKLPDRRAVLENAELRSAIGSMITAITARVDEQAVLALAAAVATQPVLYRHSIERHLWTRDSADQPAGPLGRVVLPTLELALPFLGYKSAEAARDLGAVDWYFSSDEDHDLYHDGTHERVWVKPQYRAKNALVEQAALREGIPATVANAETLPVLALKFSEPTYSALTGELFVADLRLVGGDLDVALRGTLSMPFHGDFAEALADGQVNPVPAPDGPIGLHVAAAADIISYVTRDPNYLAHAVLASDIESRPSPDLMGSFDYGANELDQTDFIRRIADRIAHDLGDDIAEATIRESEALRLQATLRETRRHLDSTFQLAIDQARKAGLAEAVLAEVEHTAKAFLSATADVNAAKLLAA